MNNTLISLNNTLISIILGILVWVAIIVFFFFITNKLKYKTIISKIIVLAIIIFEFYKIFNGSLEQFNLGILNGVVILGLTWGTIFAVHSTHIFNTLEIYFICCLFGWLFSFGLGCLEFGNIPFEQSMRTATLIGLGISAISAIFSGGQLFSLTNEYEPLVSNDGTTSNNKKITATTFRWSKNYSTTTYTDEKGNETKVDHWKF